MIVAMIKSAIVLAAAAFIASLMKKQSGAFRHAVWTAGLIGAMAIPLFTLTLPSWRTSLAAPLVRFIENAIVPVEVLQQVAIGLWIAGATAGILLLLYSAGRLAWVAIGAEPVEDARWASLADEVRRNLGIRRSVRLLQNRSVPFLGTWGILSPRVLLPRDAESWPDDRIRMVLAHELSHIQRHDWVVQVLADAARAIYWFNPIFWLASSRLRRESEHACDDAVVRLGAAGPQYAEELLAMTRALRREERLQTPILAMAQPSHLEQRLVALLNPSLNRLAATPWAVIVVAGFAIALTLPLAAVRHGQEATESNPQPATSLGTPTPMVTSPAATQPAQEASVRSTPPAVKAHIPEPAASTVAISDSASQSAASPELRTLSVTSPPVSKLDVPEPVDAVSAPLHAELRLPAPVDMIDRAAPRPLPGPCDITPGIRERKTSSVEKIALGDGPWIINEDRTIWASDQPYVANRTVTTVWMRPANTELGIVARRLDGAAPRLSVGPGEPFRTAYIAIGVTFPSAGCWEVTATAGASRLTFVTKVRE